LIISLFLPYTTQIDAQLINIKLKWTSSLVEAVKKNPELAVRTLVKPGDLVHMATPLWVTVFSYVLQRQPFCPAFLILVFSGSNREMNVPVEYQAAIRRVRPL
jgi:hypothetical protein